MLGIATLLRNLNVPVIVFAGPLQPLSVGYRNDLLGSDDLRSEKLSRNGVVLTPLQSPEKQNPDGSTPKVRPSYVLKTMEGVWPMK